jgi:hypothetical protein
MSPPASASRLSTFHESARSLRVLFWIVLPFAVAHVTLASISGYRAIVQVYRAELTTDSPTLHTGSTVDVAVTTSGRATVDAEIELIQPGHAETLAVLLVPGHTNASYDPRPIQAARRVTLTSEQLAHFRPGAARLRVTANGRSQWLRVPPPVIRERAVEIGATAAAIASQRAPALPPAAPAPRTPR